MSFRRVSFDGDVEGGRGLGSGHGERKTTRQKTIAEMIEEKMATEIKKQALSIKRSSTSKFLLGNVQESNLLHKDAVLIQHWWTETMEPIREKRVALHSQRTVRGFLARRRVAKILTKRATAMKEWNAERSKPRRRQATASSRFRPALPTAQPPAAAKCLEYGSTEMTADGEGVMIRDLREFYDAKYRLYLVKEAMRAEVIANNINLGALFSQFDEDGSGEIDGTELKALVETTGVRLKEMELHTLLTEIDEDGGGVIEVGEFTTWFNSEADSHLNKRRVDPEDVYNDKKLLERQSLRFDAGIMTLLEELWSVADADGSHCLDCGEYTDMHIQLQTIFLGDDFDREAAEAVAYREWEFDARGKDGLGHGDFSAAFFQMADQWRAGKDISRTSYVSFLQGLIDKSTYVSAGGIRRWIWMLESDLDELVDAAVDKTLGLILGDDLDLMLDAMVDDLTREERIQAEETDRFINRLIDEITLEEGDLVYQACIRASQTVVGVVGVASSMIMETKKEAASYVKVVVREARRQSFKILVGDPKAEIDGVIGLKIAEEPIVIGTNTSPTNRTNRLKIGFQTVLRPTPSRGRMESFDLPLNPDIRKLVCIDAWASTEHKSVESPKPVVSIDSGHEEYAIQNWGTRPDTSTIVKSQTGSSAMTFGNNIFGDLGAPIVGGGNIFNFRTDVRKVTGVGPTTPFVDALGVGWATPLGAERERDDHAAFLFAAAQRGGGALHAHCPCCHRAEWAFYVWLANN